MASKGWIIERDSANSRAPVRLTRALRAERRFMREAGGGYAKTPNVGRVASETGGDPREAGIRGEGREAHAGIQTYDCGRDGRRDPGNRRWNRIGTARGADNVA